MCGASGWTLTDWFENVYLSQAGPDKYDQLAAHKIRWTDPSVGSALRTLAQLWGTPGTLAPQPLLTDFPGCVSTAFGQRKAARLHVGPGRIAARQGVERDGGRRAAELPYVVAMDVEQDADQAG